MRRKYSLLSGLALVTGLGMACVDLDEELVGVVTTSYFSTHAGLEVALYGAYGQLPQVFGREQFFAVTEFGTDLSTHGDQGGYQSENTYAAALNPSAPHYANAWNPFWALINTTNAVVERPPPITGMDPPTQASRIAEAKFLRALAYYWLVEKIG